MKKETARLNKIAGQITGVAKMLEHNESCEKIIIQFQAIKGALNSAFGDFLNENLDKCLHEKHSKEIKNILKQIAKK